MFRPFTALAFLPAVVFAQPSASPSTPPRARPPSAPEHVKQGATADFSIGLAMFNAGGDYEVVHGVGGVNVGVGGFINQTVALSLRMSGAMALENALLYAGVLGPNLQVWVTPQVWIGGGLGIGFFAGCAIGCDIVKGAGYDARLGYSLSPSGHGAHLAFEVTSADVGGSRNLNTMSALIGYQSF